jgi:hypothetical protein
MSNEKRKRTDDYHDDSQGLPYSKRNKWEDERNNGPPPRKFYSSNYKNNYEPQNFEDEYKEIDSKYEEFKRRQREPNYYQEPNSDSYRRENNFERYECKRFNFKIKDFERRESPPPNYRQYSPPPYNDENYSRRRDSPPPYRRNNQDRRNNYQNDKRRRNYEKKESIVPKGISSKRILKTSGFNFFHVKALRFKVFSSKRKIDKRRI